MSGGAGFRQLPAPGEVFLDHVAHWVPDMDAAADAVMRLGFAMTPFTLHTNAIGPGAPAVPAGTGNRCVMLREGYLELLTPTADTPVAAEVKRAVDRYTGLHLAAFACADATAERERLAAAGFAVQPVVSLSREIGTESGSGTLRFIVVRPQPGSLAEGRIQFLTHETPDLLWQERWTAHANGAERLTDMVFCVADPDEAADRYARYLGRRPARIAGGWLVPCERGRLALLGREGLAAALPGIAVPTLPFMAGYAIACAELGRTRAWLEGRGLDCADAGRDAVRVATPPALGGTLVFTAAGAAPPWLRETAD